ncbi:MAG: M23 family metallopeptidase [bacterium]|nr:M23 family metallopeptidase [bacterium]
MDLASPWAGTVRAAVSGTVTFAGRVAGRMLVTIAPENRVRVSVSYLSSVWVSAGQWIRVGEVLGRSGADHGLSAVHLSLRIDGRYVNPEPALACGSSTGHPWGRLRLVSRPPSGG